MKTRTNTITSIFIFIFIVGVFSFANAQEVEPDKEDLVGFNLIKGKIVDEESGESLTFATISVEGTNIGTVTNSEGEFAIKLPKDIVVDNLAFGFLGYKNRVIPVSSLDKKKNIIKLEPSSINITEIMVRPGDPSTLIREVLNRVEENYPVDANLMTAFYRETIKQRRRYVAISEAVLQVYKAPYDRQKEDMVKIYKGRKSSDVKKQDTLIFKLQGGPHMSLLLDIIKNPHLLLTDAYTDSYNYKLRNVIHINEKLNYVIEFRQKENIEIPLYRGKIFIDINDLAITAAEFNLNIDNKEEASKMFIKKKPLSLKLEPMTTNYMVKYKEKDGKWYFNYARAEVKFKCKWKRKVFNSIYTVMSEIAVTDRTTENVAEFSRKERIKSRDILEEKVRFYTYDNFWGDYNYIEPEQSIEAAIKKFERRLKVTAY